jgi:regulatory protein
MARRPASGSTASDPAFRARVAAERLLARAPRSVAELRDRLARRGFAPVVVDDTVARLTELGWLDDLALARRRAEELLLRRGCGRLRVAFELTRRALADSVIATALTEILQDTNDVDLARAALRRKYPAPPASPAERARAHRFLLGRGHPEDAVARVLEIDP